MLLPNLLSFAKSLRAIMIIIVQFLNRLFTEIILLLIIMIIVVITRKEKWYEHCSEGVMEDDGVTLIWDMNVQCDDVIEVRRPDIVLVDKKTKSCIVMDIVVPGYCRICEKETKKIEKYRNLLRELKRLRSLKMLLLHQLL